MGILVAAVGTFPERFGMLGGLDGGLDRQGGIGRMDGRPASRVQLCNPPHLPFQVRTLVPFRR